LPNKLIRSAALWNNSCQVLSIDSYNRDRHHRRNARNINPEITH
jgi:hypothetical protein